MNDKTNVKLKIRMFELRISNRELAEKVGLTPTSLSLIINGHSEPRLRTAQRIARELGMSTDELFPLGDDK